MTLVATSHEMTHVGGGFGTVEFQMILVTFHTFEKFMTLRKFDGSPVRNTRDIAQTNEQR
jgi:hypothetical protein